MRYIILSVVVIRFYYLSCESVFSIRLMNRSRRTNQIMDDTDRASSDTMTGSSEDAMLLVTTAGSSSRAVKYHPHYRRESHDGRGESHGHHDHGEYEYCVQRVFFRLAVYNTFNDVQVPELLDGNNKDCQCCCHDRICEKTHFGQYIHDRTSVSVRMNDFPISSRPSIFIVRVSQTSPVITALAVQNASIEILFCIIDTRYGVGAPI